MHRITNPYHVDGTEGIAPMVFHQFVHPGAEPLPRLGCVRRTAQLNDEQYTPMSFCRGTGNSLKSFFEAPSLNRGLRFSIVIISVRV